MIFELSRTGRNKKCPCDSGKKFKKCCMDSLPSSISDKIWDVIKNKSNKEQVRYIWFFKLRNLIVERINDSSPTKERRKKKALTFFSMLSAVHSLHTTDCGSFFSARRKGMQQWKK